MQYQWPITSSVSSPDPDYSPDLSQVLIEPEGAFRGTRSRVAIPYNYEQSSSFTRAMSLEPLRSFFQWSDDEGKTSGYAFSATISSKQTWVLSVNMADNNHDEDFHRCMEAQEQTFKAQQATLDNIQQMLAQLLKTRTMMTLPVVTSTMRSIPTLKPLRLRNQREVLQGCRCYQRHPSSDRISNSEGWAKESRDKVSLPVGMGLSSLSTKV